MTDNNLDIRARLTGEDRMSSTVVRLMAKIKDLEAQMQKLGKGARIDSVPMEKYVKQITAAKKEWNGLTKSHYEWAKNNNVANDKARTSWNKLTKQIEEAAKAHEKAAAATGRGSKKRLKDAEDELKTLYKNAQAFRFVYNNIADKREELSRRTTRTLGEIEAAHLRNQEKINNTHFSNLSRMRRDAMRGMQELANVGRYAAHSAVYGSVGAVATGYAGASAFKTRMRMDTAETNMQIFGDPSMTPQKVKQLRKSWINSDAIKFGQSPDHMMNSYTEVLKAGIPEKIAKEVTESIMKGSVALDMDQIQTTKLVGSAATLFGDMKNLDPKSITSIMNAIAIAARDSRADASEIVAANRRGNSVVAMGMPMENLSAFTAGGVSAGLQQGKAGTFMDHMVSELLGARFLKGKKGNDIGQASNLLGLGGKSALSAKMAADPTETLMTILERTGKMSPMKQQQIAHLLGQNEWSGEFLQFVQVREKIRELLTTIAKEKGFLDEASEKKLKSIEGRWKSLKTAFTLVWESVGGGLTKMFDQISAFFTDYMGRIDVDRISATVEAFTDGIVAGLGYKNWTEALKAVFGNPEDIKNYTAQFFAFAKGFVEGFKSWAGSIISTIKSVAEYFGGKSDGDSLGQLAGRITALVLALAALSPVLVVFSSLITIINGLVAALGALAASAVGKMLLSRMMPAAAAGPAGVALGAGAAAAGAAEYFTPDISKKRPGETTTQWRERRELHQRMKKADPLFTPTSYRGSTDFSGMRRSKVDDLADQLKRFGGNVERAAFINGTPGMQYAALGGGGVVSSGFTSTGPGGSTYFGNVPSLLKSTPGTAFGPSRAAGSAGAAPSNGVPGSLNKSAYEKMFSGTPLAGHYDTVVAAAKANGISPALLAGVMAQESGRGKFLSGNNPGGMMDPATNWSKKMQFSDLGTGINRVAGNLAKRYNEAGGNLNKLQESYAPIGAANDPGGLNKGWLSGLKSHMGQLGEGGAGSAGSGDAVGVASNYLGMNEYSDTKSLAAFLGADPRGKSNAWCARFVNSTLAAAGGKGTGSAAAASFYKWGDLVRDGVKRNDVMVAPHHVGLATGNISKDGKLIEMISGNHGDAVGKSWEPIGKYQLRRGNSGLTSGVPADITSKVPTAVPPANGGAGAGAGDVRSPGNVAIHINGGNHDPEALATLVQRRVDESMNWRTHDTSSEYT